MSIFSSFVAVVVVVVVVVGGGGGGGVVVVVDGVVAVAVVTAYSYTCIHDLRSPIVGLPTYSTPHHDVDSFSCH